ncbi:MAG TPA: hypothetical protein VF180_10175 [Acidimicrobiia bacterium]
MRVAVPFEDWVVGVFDPTVEDPWPPVEQELEYLTRLFSDPIGTVEGLSDEEIGVGLWSVLDSGGAGTALALNDATLPLDARIACVHQIRTLYRELFVPRCAERLGHVSEQGGRLEMICYMFWDVAVFGGPPGERAGSLFEDAVLDVLEDTLYLEHAACQESAIHGLGHRVSRHPERAPAILDRWLRTGPIRDARLRIYAEAARTGCIQ